MKLLVFSFLTGGMDFIMSFTQDFAFVGRGKMTFLIGVSSSFSSMIKMKIIWPNFISKTVQKDALALEDGTHSLPYANQVKKWGENHTKNHEDSTYSIDYRSTILPLLSLSLLSLITWTKTQKCLITKHQ